MKMVLEITEPEYKTDKRGQGLSVLTHSLSLHDPNQQRFAVNEAHIVIRDAK